jgi:hypothetical protein
MKFLQRKSKKDIGDYLKKGYECWVAEGEEKHPNPQTGTSGLELLMQSTWLNVSYAQSHGLQRITIIEKVTFSCPPKMNDVSVSFVDPYFLGFLQLGLADIMHTLFANRLGCSCFASFDSDFRRARTVIKKTGMKILLSPEEILAVL